MAVSSYFNHLNSTNEQNLGESLVIESIKMKGMDVYYIPRESLNYDAILGETKNTSYNDFITIEVHVEEITGFGGEGDIMSKFGLQIKDTVNFTVSKKRFKEEFTTITVDRLQPVPGDLIFIPVTSSMFEINHVEHEDPFFQFGKLFVYKMTCELYTHSYEKFNTGNIEIDEFNAFTNTSEVNKAINNPIKTNSDSLIDFSESNPFGDF